MGSDLWRWADPDGQQRTVRLDELRACLAGGLIAPNTPVWRSGWSKWLPAQDVPELTSASLGGANGVVLNIPPPPLAMVAVQQEYEAVSQSIAPVPPPTKADEEPPLPPAYVPLPMKAPSMHPSSGQLKTQVGGSVQLPAARGIVVPPTPASPAARVAPGSVPSVSNSLPTAIGIPPSPELLAMAGARPRSVPPPAPPLTHGATSGAETIEELSGSMLLDAPSAGDVTSPGMNGATMDGGLPPPTDPILHDGSELPEDPPEPEASFLRRPGLRLILDDIAEIRAGRPPKNKLLVGVVGVIALLLITTLIGGIASLASGPSSTERDKKAAASASASAKAVREKASASVAITTALPVTSTATPAATATDEPKGALFGDCTATGEAKSIAARAQIASGIEAHAIGGGLALGFAPAPRDAVATLLDPTSLSPTSTVRTKPTGGDARRVTPMLVNGKLTAMPDVDRKGDRLVGRRIVPASTLIDVGSSDGGIVWAPHGRDSFARLFALDGDGAVEALRAIPLADRKGIAVAFRRSNAINVGVAKGDGVLDPDGELSRIAGLGLVGSPAVAASGDRVIVAWADRASPTDEWGLRWAKIKVGTSTTEGTSFTIPEGGLGGQAMSPSIASLGGGRFLLAWTEGPVSSHQVRAITMGADGLPSGSPLAISGAGVNAGQPVAVVGPDGRGAVAFLAAKGKGLEIHATPINCSPR